MLDLAFFRSTHRLLYPVLLISYLGLGGFLGWLIGKGEREAIVRAMIIIASMALLVSPMQLDNLAQPVQTGMAHAILFSGIAFLSVGLLAKSTTRPQRVAYTAVSVAAIILAAFSMLQGLVGAALAVILAYLVRVPALSRTVLAFVFGVCIVVYFVWPCGYRWPAHHQAFFANLYSVDGLAEFAAHTSGNVRRFSRSEAGHNYRFGRRRVLVARSVADGEAVVAVAPNRLDADGINRHFDIDGRNCGGYCPRPCGFR